MTAHSSLARVAYRGLACYTVDQTAIEIDLRDNTNLWGVPPGASRAIVDAAQSVSRYPQVYAQELRAALADYVGVDADRIVTGCGSDDVLDACFRALADPGDRIAVLAPSFVPASMLAQMNALTPVSITIDEDWNTNVDALVATEPRIIYLCSPNNPTGAIVPPWAIDRLLHRSRCAIVIDEAYAEYAGASAAWLTASCERLLIVRTLSKAFGLAGLRIGYAIAAVALIQEVEKARGPFKVNLVAERAAVTALRADREWVRERVHEVVVNRERLALALGELGLNPLPSGANFLLCPTRDATGITRGLALVGVGVRCFVGVPTLGDAIRITVGPWSVMETYLQRLADVLAARSETSDVEARCA